MKLHLGLVIFLSCLGLQVQAPEARDNSAGVADESIKNRTTVAARQQSLTDRLASVRELRKEKEFLRAAQLLNEAGHLQLDLNLPEEALATFQENRVLLDQVSDPAASVDALTGMGAAYLHRDQYKEAIPVLEQAVTTSEQNVYPAGKAEALLLLSACQNYTDRPLALKTAQLALVLWQNIPNNRGIARSHISIGTYQLAQTMLADATQSFETALNLSQAFGFGDLQAEALINLGFVEYRKGAWQKVTSLLADAEGLVDGEAEPFKMGQINVSLAEAYIESGLPEVGLPKYYKALEFYSKTKNPGAVIGMVWGIGRTHYLLGNYPEALVNLQRALADAELKELPGWVAMCHEYLGRTHDAMNNHESALSNFETALSLYSRLGNPMEAARVRALIGQIHETSGAIDRARESYQQALQSFDTLSDRVNESATLFALGRLEMKSGNFDTAESHLRRSIEATETMRRMSTSRDLTAAFSATVHDRYQQYIQCLMRNDRGPNATSRAVLAFETSESARARSLAELLSVSETDLLSHLDPKLSKQEKSLRQLIRVKEDERLVLLAKEHKKETLETLEIEVRRVEAEYKTVAAAISARYPAYDQITKPIGWKLDQIQQQVISDNDTILLEYLLGSEKSYVWAVTRNSFTSHEIPAEAVIGKAVEAVYELLREPAKPDSTTKLARATNELTQMILSPVADQLDKRRIIVIADSALNYIPFQTLAATSTNTEPLVAEHEIINAPSASILGTLREEVGRRGVRSKALAAFGNPVFARTNEQRNDTKENAQIALRQKPETDHLRYALRDIELNGDTFDPSVVGRLFFAEREVANLRDIASPVETFAATDFAATRDQLLTMDLSQYAILHFATHGLLDPKRPEYSGLLLSTIDRDGKPLNGFVGLQDVYSLRAPVDLVVLSACQTGLGKDIRSEGLVGLTRGFMYAGATTVVASLWKVDDEATAELMKRFYTEMLQNGKTPGEALRAAQNSIRQVPEWSAPHHWAGFTLQGEYRYVVNSSHGSRAYSAALVAGILCLLAIASCGYLYRVGKLTQH